jgi:adenine-specific DNA-methyltransferase
LLAAVARREPGAELFGWDIDPAALEAAGRLVPDAGLLRRSALEPPGPGQAGYDLVIANPPYFQVRVTPQLKARFGEVISGRANVFALFFKAGLDLLVPGGELAFIVPPSMNSGAYFEALREHIIERAGITDLTLLEGSGVFEGANTAAQLLVLEKGGAGKGFVFEHAEPEAGFRRVVFSESPELLRQGFEGRRTLWQLGYEAVTGTVVWNQRRADLRPSPGAGTVPLVWSRDLRGGAFAASQRRSGNGSGRGRAKPGYIRSDRRMSGPALLVNRVIGAVGRGEIRTAFMPDGTEFLAENHVNVIRLRLDRDAPDRPGLDWDRLQRAIEAPGTGDRARLLTGNTQLSATELTHLLPVRAAPPPRGLRAAG